MNRVTLLALCLWCTGLVSSGACLVHTTHISMMAFTFVGIPAFGLAAALYLSQLLLALRRRQIL
jgi:hypothetical protein